MGFLDKLKGVKQPVEGTPAVSKAELMERLLALGHEQVPFTVGVGEGADLEAQWKIVDAAWYEVFAKAGLEKVHKIHLRLDKSEHEVLALEESWEVSWRAGVPALTLSVEAFQGRTFGSKEFGRAYAFTGVNPLQFGEAYNYRFDVSEMKDPIIEVVTQSGWKFVPVLTKGKIKK
ncbi:MAG: hypothetical protein LC739_05000 [Actinobacteria bacterium]|nr:hypothetical protein [Actinomycetota bacterium]